MSCNCQLVASRCRWPGRSFAPVGSAWLSASTHIRPTLGAKHFRSSMFSSASLRESRRLCVVLFLAAPPVVHHRPPAVPDPLAVPGPTAECAPSPIPSCNSQLQLATFPRSVDYRGLIWHLSPCRINTSKNLCRFYISLISGHLKSPIINTSVNFDFKPSRINTSKKHGGGWRSSRASGQGCESRAQRGISLSRHLFHLRGYLGIARQRRRSAPRAAW